MKRIIHSNIDRFKPVLEAEADPTKQAMLFRLLAEQGGRTEKGQQKHSPVRQKLISCVSRPK